MRLQGHTPAPRSSVNYMCGSLHNDDSILALRQAARDIAKKRAAAMYSAMYRQSSVTEKVQALEESRLTSMFSQNLVFRIREAGAARKRQVYSAAKPRETGGSEANRKQRGDGT